MRAAFNASECGSSRQQLHGAVVVAIPVKDEEDRIGCCLTALDNQVADRPDQIVLLLNNCTDRTAAVVHGLSPRLTCDLHIIEVELAVDIASAGYARHLALEHAYKLAGPAGILLTTDADGLVDPDWVGANLAALRSGLDAVAGWAELNPADWGSIPIRLHEDDAQECAYDAVCDEIHALLDPDAWDPLPRHTQASGASIAVTAQAYCAAGGMPVVPCGEDRAFIAALRLIDARIRHAPECRVVVSGRNEGRAVGGMADTIRRRMFTPDVYLDARLEPAENCARRAALRHLARLAHKSDRLPGDLPALLDLQEAIVLRAMIQPTFGAAWANLETVSPMLTGRRVEIERLSDQQARAEQIRELARRDASLCSNTVLEQCLLTSAVANPYDHTN